MNVVRALAWIAACLWVQSAPRSQLLNSAAIDAYTVAKMRSAHFPGVAVAIVEGDRVVYMKTYGRADPSGRAVTPQTPFMLGSITKSITALAIMQLVDAGKVDLDAPVQRYLPWFRLADPRAAARITVRHLLTMTSGIRQSYETELWPDSDDRALERAVRLVATTEPAGPAGSTFGYSNANYETLGMIVQAVSGESYEDYLKTHIFAPLDMRHTYVSQDEAIRNGMASGHRWWFGVPVAVTLPFNRSELPAGYVIASTEDMTHVLIAELNDGRYESASVLSPRAMALRHLEPPVYDYGFGWEFIHEHGHTIINHDGGTMNSQASVFIDLDASVGVYIAANAISALDAFASPSGSSPLDGTTTRAMAHTILNLATNRPVPDTRPGIERLTAIFDLVIALLTIALIVSLVRMPGRLARLAQRGIPTRTEERRRIGLAIILNWTLPIALLWATLDSAPWQVIVPFQPDLAYWLDGVAIVLFVKGALEIAVLRRHRAAPSTTAPPAAAAAR